MSGHVVKLPHALHDLDEAADYIRRQSCPDRAIRFLRAADSTFARLARMPGLGRRHEPYEPLYADLRYFPVSRFRAYLVFYRPVPGGGIEVVRVLHGARDLHGILAQEFGIEDATDEEAGGEE